ncbi:cation channel sperm-associated protein 1-like isoform X2 [Limulus polyphemus]|uniref:Cation channel sperm-associated protein 1-like isoform X2 n=1 Tax=Limulus polyphemus TaxID=6850 RepID=A0ABM1TQJ1_LIMPO|nr:cation channel sperm-associated protein 1-like isoform X2 [Limulus polyphemus]
MDNDRSKTNVTSNSTTSTLPSDSDSTNSDSEDKEVGPGQLKKVLISPSSLSIDYPTKRKGAAKEILRQDIQNLLSKRSELRPREREMSLRTRKLSIDVLDKLSRRLEVTKELEIATREDDDIHIREMKKNILSESSQLRCVLLEIESSKIFSGIIFSVILLNTALLMAQTFEVAEVRAGFYLNVLDSMFLAFYIIEMILKIFVWRKFYFHSGWNLLDFVIVMLSVFELVLPLMLESVGNFQAASIFRVLRIFRTIRALRALRVLRTIRFLKSLQIIINTLFQSIQSMGAIGTLMALFMYVFAVIGRGLYHEVNNEKFGDLGKSIFTLYQLLTLDDWFMIYKDTLKENKSYWHILIFLIVYIVVEYFIFLNLFVAVLVDNFQLTLEKSALEDHDNDFQDENLFYKEEEKEEEKHSRASTPRLLRNKTVEEIYPDFPPEMKIFITEIDQKFCSVYNTRSFL